MLSIKFSDWQHFQKAFNNRSVVVSAINEPSNGINNYKVKYYQLTQPLNVVKVGDLYQFTYNNVIYNVAYVSNYLFKATSIVDSSKELECIAQVNTLDDLVKDTNFAVILRNEDKESDDGTYTVTFSVASPDDKFLNGTLGKGYEDFKNFYDFHKLALDEINAFDYEEYKKNGFKNERLGEVYIRSDGPVGRVKSLGKLKVK